MAEGWLRHIAREELDVFSAGTAPQPIHPLAIEAMQERGVDISSQRSKSIDEFHNHRFDFVITVCDHAQGNCPTFPEETRQIHWNFQDPAKAQGTPEEQKIIFVQVRDEIEEHVRRFVGSTCE